MGGTTSEIFGLAASIVTVALIVALIARGDKTVKVLTAAGNVFTNSLKVATGQAGKYY